MNFLRKMVLCSNSDVKVIYRYISHYCGAKELISNKFLGHANHFSIG